jgi:hypothetical protein
MSFSFFHLNRIMDFKLFLENTVTWVTESSSHWVGYFSAGDKQFTIDITFEQVTDPNLHYQLWNQEHLQSKNMRKKIAILRPDMASIVIKDQKGRTSNTGEIGPKIHALETSMHEVFETLWEKRKPAFILFEAQHATKILVYDRMIQTDRILRQHYTPLKLHTGFRQIHSINPSEHYSTWVLQRNDLGKPKEKFEPLDRTSKQYQIMRAKIRQERGTPLPGDDIILNQI